MPKCMVFQYRDVSTQNDSSRLTCTATSAKLALCHVRDTLVPFLLSHNLGLRYLSVVSCPVPSTTAIITASYVNDANGMIDSEISPLQHYCCTESFSKGLNRAENQPALALNGLHKETGSYTPYHAPNLSSPAAEFLRELNNNGLKEV